MRKRLLFALLPYAAASLPLVALASASQDKVAGSQSQQKPKQAQTTRPPAVPKGFRLLSLTEGRTIVQGIAWADDEEGLSPDCSHLVHTLYERAGYSYGYANSLDLYRGAPPFLRVRSPHPGDLVVWRGHVGIVVNPSEHTFFSSVTAGTGIQHYDSPYWRARGHARFFRYLTNHSAEAGGRVEEATNRLPQPREQGASGGANDAPALRSVKTSPPANKPRGETAGRKQTEVAAASAPSVDDPAAISLRTGTRKPEAADVAHALAAANSDAGEVLRAANLEQLKQPVVVYRELQVSGVAVKGKRGAAQVQIETLAAVSAERMEAQQGWEDHQFELQRTKKGWVMTPANQNVYIPRDVALRTLSARLAALTQSPDRGTQKDREQADIIRFLNLLVE